MSSEFIKNFLYIKIQNNCSRSTIASITRSRCNSSTTSTTTSIYCSWVAIYITTITTTSTTSSYMLAKSSYSTTTTKTTTANTSTTRQKTTPPRSSQRFFAKNDMGRQSLQCNLKSCRPGRSIVMMCWCSLWPPA